MRDMLSRVKTFHVKRQILSTGRGVSRESFADAELTEDYVQKVLDINATGDAA